MRSSNNQTNTQQHSLDLTGLRCPVVLLKVKQAIKSLSANTILSVKTNDPASANDIPRWIALTPHQMLNVDQHGNGFTLTIECKI